MENAGERDDAVKGTTTTKAVALKHLESFDQRLEFLLPGAGVCPGFSLLSLDSG